jgi:hypothetical protein
MQDIHFIDRRRSFVKLEDPPSLVKFLSSGMEYCPAYGVRVPTGAAFARYCPLICELMRFLDSENKAPAIYMAEAPISFGCSDYNGSTCPLQKVANDVALELALRPGHWEWREGEGNVFVDEQQE